MGYMTDKNLNKAPIIYIMMRLHMLI